MGRITVGPAKAITQTILNHVGEMAEEAGASAVFVYLDALSDPQIKPPESIGDKVIYVTRTAQEQKEQNRIGKRCLRVPNVPLTRMGQVKVAVFLALSRNMIHPGDIVVSLTGIAESGTLDTIMITDVGREYEVYSASEDGHDLPADVSPEVVERVLDLATELGNEGREGKPVGAIFVIGDSKRVMELSHQLILNPFRGYSEEQRNILDENLEETVKEFSTIDGAFIIRSDGVIETCGAFLETTKQKDLELPRGLGARHYAAAAITAATDAVAITVSESTGTVTIFRHGKPITEIEKPRSTAVQHERYLAAVRSQAE